MTGSYLDEYRTQLVIAEQKSQDDYDKTLVSLSGGALGISMLFIRDIAGDGQPGMLWALIAAWAVWALSLTSVVVSYFLSRIALRKAIEQTDQTNFSDGVGGWASLATQVCNVASGVLFLAGVVFLIIFAGNNIGAQ